MKIFLAILFVSLLVFLGVDLGIGTTQAFETTIVDHCYTPAWSEISVYTDGEGNSHTTITHHPEQFVLVCKDITTGKTFSCDETSQRYHSKTNGQYATVKTRQGKFTHIQWLPHIID